MNHGSHINLAPWGRACHWSDGQGESLHTGLLHPQTVDGRQVWLPVWMEDRKEWHIGFEWDEPRDVTGVAISYLNEKHMCPSGSLKVEYWNCNWPQNNPERHKGAVRGWFGVDDPRHGTWIEARGAFSECTLQQSFTFDHLDMPEMGKERLELAEDLNAEFRRTLKLRLVFACEIQPVIASIQIFGTALLMEDAVCVYFGCGRNEREDWSGSISVHNGKLLGIAPVGFDAGDGIADSWQWNCVTAGEPKGISARYLKASGSKAQGDRTLLTLKTKAHSFTLAADDLEKGPVWLKPYGILAARGREGVDWREAVEKAKTGRENIYDKIGCEKDQSCSRVFQEMPPLDVAKVAPYGRYVVMGWEGVRQEYALRYNGEVFSEKGCLKLSGRDASKILWAGSEIHFRLASGDPPDFRLGAADSRQWAPEPQVPIYMTQWVDREIEYTQETFCALADGPARGPDDIAGDEEIAAMLRVTIRNTTEGRKKALLWLDITPQEELALEGGGIFATGRVIPSETVKHGWKTQPYKKPILRCVFEPKGKGRLGLLPLSQGRELTNSEWSLDTRDWLIYRKFGKKDETRSPSSAIADTALYCVELDGLESHAVDIVIPFSSYTEKACIDKVKKLSFDEKREEVREYWNGFHAEGAKIRLPEKEIEDFAKAVPWHILISADKDPASGQYTVPAATYIYGACGNEACLQIRLLDMLGYHSRAEKYLDAFLLAQGRKKPDGDFQSAEGAFLAPDFDNGKIDQKGFLYNLDHGFILSCFADHYMLSGDRKWLERVSGNLVAACDFVIRERKATMTAGEDGVRPAHYGLLPAGHLEDNPEWRYWFAVNAHACGGMIKIAEALKDIAHPESGRIAAEAAAYRMDIRASVLRSMEESPVVRLPDGSYIPHVPTRTGIRGREWGWIREALYGPLHLVDGLVFEPDEEIVTWILRDLEDNLFVTREYGRPVDIDRYWFSQGGVCIQADLLGNALAYLRRDQVSHAIRALYNTLGQQLFTDVHAFTEHPVIELGHGFGPFFKVSDEAQFLVYLRNFIVREDGQTLWICQGAPRHWFEDGGVIQADGLATAFGPVYFRAESKIQDDIVEIELTIPERRPPERILLRVRHPEGRPMKAVSLGGAGHADFDAQKELICLKGLKGALRIIAHFAD